MCSKWYHNVVSISFQNLAQMLRSIIHQQHHIKVVDAAPSMWIVSIHNKWRASVETTDNIRTEVYQVHLHHKQFADPINVVCILKTHLLTEQKSHVLLFSSDLKLSALKMIDFYALRFQIEFNFRNAKQYWGLEDFMNVKKHL